MSLQRLYLASACSVTKQKDCDWMLPYLEQERAYTLESFWYKEALTLTLKKTEKMKVFLDSGAYSWHSELQKKGINPSKDKKKQYLDNYISFILENKNRLHAYANLDVVGDPEKTLINQEYMEKAGLSPVAVFHYSLEQNDVKNSEEQYQYLQKMVDKYDYIALGGGASSGLTGNAYVQRFGDIAFKIISKKPQIKVHGFGITSVPLLLRYPWYSADATTWIKHAAYGAVLVPRYNEFTGGFDYSKLAQLVSTSKRAKYGTPTRPHFTLVHTQEAIKKILDYFASKNLSETDLENSWSERAKANLIYYEDLAKFLSSYKREKIYIQKRFF